MRIAAAVSVALHVLVLAVILARWQGLAAPPAEVQGKIEMVFGKNALTQGTPAHPVAKPAPAPAAASAAPVPRSDVGSMPASTPSVRTAQVAAPPAPEPVRLGDGLVGFDVPQPDANIVQAQSDPGNRPPRFPEAARIRGEHGTVVLRIHIRPDGQVAYIETLQSSGFADLDDAAREAARRWHFIPQLRAGAAVASTRDQAVDFMLE